MLASPEMSVFFEADHLPASCSSRPRYGRAKGAGAALASYSSRSKDLERTAAPHLHTPPIPMLSAPAPCSPVAPPPLAGLSSFHRLRCKLQYSRAIRSDMKIYASPDQNNARVLPHPRLAGEQRTRRLFVCIPFRAPVRASRRFNERKFFRRTLESLGTVRQRCSSSAAP